MKKIALIIFVFIFFACAQTCIAKNVLSIKADNRLLLIYEGKFDEAKQTLENDLKTAEAEQNKREISAICNYLGLIYFYRENFSEALKYFEQAINAARDGGCQKETADALNNIGAVALFSGKHDKAREFFEASKSIFEQINDKDGLASAYNSLGGAALAARKPDEAIEYYRKAANTARETNNKREIAQSYLGLGVVNFYCNDPDKSISFLAESLKIAKENNLAVTAAYSYFVTAQAYLFREEYPNAAKNYTEAAALFESFTNIPKFLESCTALANIYRDKLNDPLNALKYYEKILEVSIKLKNVKQEAEALFSIGQVYREQQKYSAAAEYFQQALKISENISDKALTSNILLNIGKTFDDQKNCAAAVEFYEKCLKEAEGIIDKQLSTKIKATAANNAAVMFYFARNYASALKFFEKALDLFRELSDTEQTAKTYNYLGLISLNYGNYSEAIQHFDEALKIFSDSGNKSWESTILSNMGVVYNTIGKSDESIKCYEKALKLNESINDRQRTATSLNNIGVVFLSHGNYKKAMQCQQKALNLSEESGDFEGETASLSNIGVIYDFQGNYDKAAGCYEKVLNIREKTNDLPGTARTLVNFGYLLISLGKYDEALEKFDKALKIFEETGDKTGIAHSCLNIGKIYEHRAEYDKVRSFYAKASEIFKLTGNLRGQAYASENFASSYLEEGDFEKSLLYCGDAIKLASGLNDRELLWKLYYRKGLAEEKLNKLKPAKENYEKSIAYIEQLREISTGSEEERAFAFARKTHVYHAIIRVLLKLGRQSAKPSYGEKHITENKKEKFIGDDYGEIAFYYAEKSKARTVLELLTQGRAKIKEGISKELLDKETEILSTLNSLQKKYDEISSLGEEKSEELGRIKKLIETKEAEFEQIKERIRASSSRYAGLIYPDIPTVAAVMGGLKKGAAIIEYVAAEDRVFCFVVKKDDFTAIEIPVERKVITEEVAELLSSAVQSRGRGFNKKTAVQICDYLIDPLDDKLKNISEIVIVPDGFLNYMPFEFLISGGLYLIEKYTISYAPSVNFFKIIGKKAVKEDRIAAFGDPDFNENMLARPNESAPARETTQWKNLPGSKYEAQAIGKIFGKSEVFLGKGATEERVKEKMAQYPLLHLATHGMLSDLRPLLYSSLIFAGANIQNPSMENDGYLRAAEVFNCKTNAGLIVLSGCETGKGDVFSGEGLMGLSTAFFYAGARSLIVSLWSVDDAATSEFFKYFYENLKEKKMPKASALRDAKLKLMKEKKYPFYWAPFILIGGE